VTTIAHQGTAPEWEHLYEAAVLELDRRHLAVRIEVARRAILDHLQQIDPADREQTEPLNNALQVLQDLNKIDREDGRVDAA
jgi:hypothetical protein